MPTRPRRAKGGIDSSPNPHFGQDFRDLYISAHLPILTDGGMDFKIGRMNTIMAITGSWPLIGRFIPAIISSSIRRTVPSPAG